MCSPRYHCGLTRQLGPAAAINFNNYNIIAGRGGYFSRAVPYGKTCYHAANVIVLRQ
jgi:hypothetical protein